MRSETRRPRPGGRYLQPSTDTRPGTVATIQTVSRVTRSMGRSRVLEQARSQGRLEDTRTTFLIVIRGLELMVSQMMAETMMLSEA